MKDEKIDYKGKLLQIVSWEGEPGKRYEKAVRAPGVRVLAESLDTNGDKIIYLSKEKRREAEGIDYRLPGGKVFDSLNEYNDFSGTSEELKQIALSKAKAEAKEEAGIEAENLEFITISKTGASVDWDLYYFLATNITLGDNELKENEVDDIKGLEAVTPEKLYELLLTNKIQEGRSADQLWKWLAKNEYITINNK